MSYWRQWSFATFICFIRFPVLKAVLEDISYCVLCSALLMVGKSEQGTVDLCLWFLTSHLQSFAVSKVYSMSRGFHWNISDLVCVLHLSLSAPVPFITIANCKWRLLQEHEGAVGPKISRWFPFLDLQMPGLHSQYCLKFPSWISKCPWCSSMGTWVGLPAMQQKLQFCHLGSPIMWL